MVPFLSTYSHKISSALKILHQPAKLFTSAVSPVDFSGYDGTQVELMREKCIEVDEQDKVIKARSKMECHLMKNGPPLHRAFSLFLFNSQNELLLQKRSASKITFPEHYTNTCCSHPLFTEAEMVEAHAAGVKKAAQRRTEYELGIPADQLPLSSIHYITRVHYSAPCSEIWGEHEIDYILIAQRNVDVKLNTNEVSEVQWIPKDKIHDFISHCTNSGIPITPWFQLMVKSQLFHWWNNLNDLTKCYDHKKIMRC